MSRWPKHASRDLRKRFRNEANGLRAFYGVPVYLVGSALIDANEQPRDWDVRLTISHDEFTRRYGSPQRWEAEGYDGQWTKVRWRWSDDCTKQSQRLSGSIGVLVDVQIYPTEWAQRFRGKPRLRLDTRVRVLGGGHA